MDRADYFYVRTGKGLQLHNGSAYRPFTLSEAVKVMKRLREEGDWPMMEFAFAKETE